MSTQFAPNFSTDATRRHTEKIETGPGKKGPQEIAERQDVSLGRKPELTCRANEKIPLPPASSERDVIADIERLTRMELRRRYKAEANSHRNMLHRQKTSGAVVDPELNDFVNFLRHVGPMPAHGATLDRIDNADPEYAPGKVRWADKRTQNSNKGDSLTFHDSKTGKVFTTSRLAKKQKVKPGTIRKRLERGWSDAEIIKGRGAERPSVPADCSCCPNRQSLPNPVAPSTRRHPHGDHDVNFERMAESFRIAREEYGIEALPAPLDDLNEVIGDCAPPVTPENYERTFKRMWPNYRPHLIYDRATPFHQELIAKIDPVYVERWKAKAASKVTLADAL
jgi:hypothetical protein